MVDVEVKYACGCCHSLYECPIKAEECCERISVGRNRIEKCSITDSIIITDTEDNKVIVIEEEDVADFINTIENVFLKN